MEVARAEGRGGTTPLLLALALVEEVDGRRGARGAAFEAGVGAEEGEGSGGRTMMSMSSLLAFAARPFRLPLDLPWPWLPLPPLLLMDPPPFSMPV